MDSVFVENIKCGGCATSIKNKLMEIQNISEVVVHVELGRVDYDTLDPEQSADSKPAVLDTLTSMGYPAVGSVEGLQAVGAKAKSFVSCATGRMSAE